MNLKFSLKFKGVSERTLTMILLGGVLLVLGLQGLWVKDAFDRITEAATLVPQVKETQVVRINFNAYESSVKKITNTELPVPFPEDTPNPFKSVK